LWADHLIRGQTGTHRGSAHDRAIGPVKIRHDEPDAREQLAEMMLTFRDDAPRLCGAMLQRIWALPVPAG
jgi:hypothetical protein